MARQRDAERTRRLLLDSASELFADRGYDRTTLRDVGRRAGVDPALVVRYFDSKVGLYVAVLRARTGDADPAPLTSRARLIELLASGATPGRSPLLPAAVAPHADPATQEVVRAELYARLVAPLEAAWTTAGVEQAGLRAEIAAAAILGVALTRSAGTFPLLSAVAPEDLAELAHLLVAAIGPK